MFLSLCNDVLVVQNEIDYLIENLRWIKDEPETQNERQALIEEKVECDKEMSGLKGSYFEYMNEVLNLEDNYPEIDVDILKDLPERLQNELRYTINSIDTTFGDFYNDTHRLKTKLLFTLLNSTRVDKYQKIIDAYNDYLSTKDGTILLDWFVENNIFKPSEALKLFE